MKAAHAFGSLLIAACVGLFAAFSAEARSNDGQREEGFDLAPPAPVADGRASELEGWKEHACARCHTAIAREWASTRHAQAWVDELYQDEIALRTRPESCHGCHIPQPVRVSALGVRPKPRSDELHFGVTCESCHADSDGTILGPFELETAAHRSRSDASMRAAGTNGVCSTCHATSIGPVVGIAKDFVDSKLEAQGKSCVACHMAPLERVIANEIAAGDPIAAHELAPRHGRSHALQTPRDPHFLRQAFRIEARQQATEIVVTIANRAGHRVPGLIGRTIAFEAELIGEPGALSVKATLVLDTRTPLAVGGVRELTLAGRAQRVRLRGVHDAAGLPDKVTFLEQVLDVAP